MSHASNPFALFLWISMLIAVGFGGGWQCRDARSSKARPVDPNAEDWLTRFSETELRYDFAAEPPYDRILIFDTANGHVWVREAAQIIDLGTPAKPKHVIADVQSPTRFSNRSIPTPWQGTKIVPRPDQQIPREIWDAASNLPQEELNARLQNAGINVNDRNAFSGMVGVITLFDADPNAAYRLVGLHPPGDDTP